MSPTDFSWEPAYIVLAVVTAGAYAWAARADRPNGWRIAAFAAGAFLVAAPLNSPLETIAAKRLLLVHLLQNALIADIAPLLVLLGLTPAMKTWVARHGGSRIRARWAIVAWLAAWYGTHLAGFYNWALDTGWALNIEHGLLIAGGLLFWWPLVSGRLSAPAALAYLGAAFVASSFLGLAFIFSSHPFYPFYEHAPRLWGFSPTRDQNLGGIAMNGEQTLVFLVAIGYYVSRLLSEESTTAPV
ncbi:MAG: cytochrome c oxidase assembly protein [Actinobacteria bacterium]|jgi:cytochrome c oxidase assembly factor CtaG|nr:MAG: cytochrome c oxidase assembly protein [Actinomycetota bacterium]